MFKFWKKKKEDLLSGRPEKIAIDHDDYHAKHIGRTSDEKQFFLTQPFEPAVNGQEGAEYVVLFLFESDGNFIEAKVDKFGPRKSVDPEKICECYDGRLKELGPVEYCRIEVKPFSVERFGTNFGLIIREPEEYGEVWAVELHPGNYMAFFEPWDSGEYDT